MEYESDESRRIRYMGLGGRTPAEITRLKKEVPWMFIDYRSQGTYRTEEDSASDPSRRLVVPEPPKSIFPDFGVDHLNWDD